MLQERTQKVAFDFLSAEDKFPFVIFMICGIPDFSLGQSVQF